MGGLAPTYLNAADELAVAAFLEGRIGFDAIPRVLAAVLEATPAGELGWDVIRAADAEARRLARRQTELVAR